ncbi:MAG: hypothetical protein KC433_12340 [Anaerolineales bacterium]|nr:hypothetical protein [Anaerolineales bacterium]
MFFNDKGYVEMVFFGMVPISELQQLLREMSRLAKIHGPTGFLLDGRFGRIPAKANILQTFAKIARKSAITHMVILTEAPALRKAFGRKPSTGSLIEVRANAFGIPQVFMTDEDKARRRAANQGYVAMFYWQARLDTDLLNGHRGLA